MEAFSFERKIKHYSTRAFGLAVNMVATSLDSRESLMLKYSKALSNVKELEARGCIVLHEVDVHSMSQHPFLIRLRFDRIIYNFPHAGYLLGPFSSERNRFQIWFHQDLIRGFLKNALELLTAIGEIHVTHKTTFPFSEWKIVELAHEVGLYLVDEEPFSLWDYPGYENKRGDGMCDQTFPVGMCSTFKFAKLFYHSSPSCFHLSITDSGPWSGYSGINGPHMESNVSGNMPKYTGAIEYSKAYSSRGKQIEDGEKKKKWGSKLKIASLNSRLRRERWHPTVKAKRILEEKIHAEEPDPGKKTRRPYNYQDACMLTVAPYPATLK
ncbi:hypothetical protein L3X38_022716 [Prunus dulcis]|uniref:25S rRNA (uridine-N(3))-methyltransferase BMT5-like domain-containing protein n=1 Tax=Prunus dulcis TaxID=3755 RepID=A0AAD4Z3T7_PRUDU|nr:hypothetical protein L3X38_022716 [Prunus dulcis]